MALDIARRFAEARATAAKQKIINDLGWLKVNVERAIASAQRGERVDEHIIHNAVQVTAEIGRHNLLIDLMPTLFPEPGKDK